MSESDKKEMEISLPGEWAVKKLLGPVFSELGEDFRLLYALGRDKIIQVACRKTENIEDGKIPNLRVTRDVFWNGAFTDDEVCAEYFGGILASSRTTEGKDDSAIQYVDVIKSLSSKQLRLHYLIYNALNRMFVEANKAVSVAHHTHIEKENIWISSSELVNVHELKIETDLNCLWRLGLISSYEYNSGKSVKNNVPYLLTRVHPNTFGIMLYAAAHNKIDHWLDFPSLDFGNFEWITPINIYAGDPEAIINQLETSTSQ